MQNVCILYADCGVVHRSRSYEWDSRGSRAELRGMKGRQNISCRQFKAAFVCLLAWCLTALSAQIGYIVP